MPRNPDKRKCEFPDCANYAMRSGTFCRTHAAKLNGGTLPGGAPKHNQNAKTHGFYAKHVNVRDLQSALDVHGVDGEIAVLRVKIADVLASGLPITETAPLLRQLITSLTLLLKLQQLLNPKSTNDLDDALANVLTEMGLA